MISSDKHEHLASMRRIAKTIRKKWAMGLVLLAIFMFSFAGGYYSHTPGHHHVHAIDESQNAINHEHIEISDNIEIGTGSMLHCGADISADIEADIYLLLPCQNMKGSRVDKKLKAYLPARDPPPPRSLS